MQTTPLFAGTMAIAQACIAHLDVPVGDIPALILGIHGALASIGGVKPAAPPPQKSSAGFAAKLAGANCRLPVTSAIPEPVVRVPATPIRKSIYGNRLIRLKDGTLRYVSEGMSCDVGTAGHI